jgi:hypothetical protein
LVKTSVPDAAVRLSVDWLNSSRLWYANQKLGGTRILPVKSGEWTMIDMEIVVPDSPEIKHFSPLVGGIHTYPGKVWVGELKLETIAPK